MSLTGLLPQMPTGKKAPGLIITNTDDIIAL
jgi:hypothetical protein